MENEQKKAELEEKIKAWEEIVAQEREDVKEAEALVEQLEQDVDLSKLRSVLYFFTLSSEEEYIVRQMVVR